VKAFGREVREAGLGLYYLTPMAFVDTSDMWLEPRRRRIFVNLSGIATNMALGGAAVLAALLVAGPQAQAVFWLVALYNYFSVVANLNPLLELDGYYALSDALDRPRLRQDSLGWLGRWWRTDRSWAAARGHRVELLFGLSAVVYAIGLAAATVVMYRRWLLDRMAGALPAWAAESLGFALALAVVGVLLAGVVQDLRGGRRA
jgi:putative peptide zinc metalloprotease protein